MGSVDIRPSLPTWRGRTVWKYPGDFLLYQEEIYKNRPDFIIETGTKEGGSTLFFGDMLDIIDSPGKVISIDINPIFTPKHKKVEYIQGNSADRAIAERVKNMVSGRVMVILDSLHTMVHVWREIRLYAPLVTVGQAMVVEDCCVFPYGEEPRVRKWGPENAIIKLLNRSTRFVREYPETQFYKPQVVNLPTIIAYCITTKGWLRRIK